jgi:hypothetical protein
MLHRASCLSAIFAFSLSLFSVPALATSDGFLQIGQMFDGGIGFDITTKVGWYSGRCWYPTSEAAFNGLLVIGERANNDGPAFPSTYNFQTLYSKVSGPAYFDNLDPVSLGTIANTVNQDWYRYSHLSTDEIGYSNAISNVREHVRRSADDQYFVVKFVNADGTVPLTCYYFKKIL